jgi:hypothetical protein
VAEEDSLTWVWRPHNDTWMRKEKRVEVVHRAERPKGENARSVGEWRLAWVCKPRADAWGPNGDEDNISD